MHPIVTGKGSDFLVVLLTPASSAVLAFSSTIHFALAVLRKERSFRDRRFPFLLLPTFAFAAAPWLMPSPAGLLLGVATHIAWFVTCERLLPVAAPAAKPAVREARPAPLPAAAATPFRAQASKPPPGFADASVLAVFDETPDIRTFRIARPHGFEFQPGQFLSVRVTVGGKPVVRCYTISSAPEAAGYLEISVKRQGLVSNALHSDVSPGSQLSIRGPGGKFVYPEDDSRPIVLIAGGVGVTPMMSMLRHAVSRQPQRPVTLLFSARTESDIAFRGEIENLARRHPQFRVVIAVTRASESPEFFPGRIDEHLLRSVVTVPDQPLYFICGPIPMIDSMKKTLASVGVPGTQVHSEAFEAAVAWAAAPANAGRNASSPAADPAPSRSALPASKARLQLARTGTALAVHPGETLLEAAERAGANIEFSCRTGVCGTCRTRLLTGEVDCDAAGLDSSDRGEGWIFPCVALARSDCKIDA